MKVLLISAFCGVGAAGRICCELQNALIERGDDCVVAYGRGKAQDSEFSYKIANKFDNYFDALKSRFFDSQGRNSTIPTKRLIRLITNYQPDIIHIHVLHGYYLNVISFLNYLSTNYQGQIIITMHDEWLMTGHCSNTGYVHCDKYISGCNHCPQKKAYPSSLIFDCSKSNYRAKKEAFSKMNNLTIVTPSFWLRRVVQNSFLKRFPLVTIRNGIDLKVFQPQAFDDKTFGKRKIVLGVANYWTKTKGYEDFLWIAERLPRDIQIVLIGKRKKCVISKKIQYVEQTADPKILSVFYSKALVFVNPSYQDILPTVNMEAQACGCPVVCYDSDGMPESVNAISSVIVPKGNKQGLLDTIVSIADGRVSFDRDKIAMQAEEYSGDEFLNKYLALYGRLFQKS